MSPFSENPFTVMTLIVAPAVLTNASSVLSLGTGNRLARVVDRSKEITKELEALGPKTEIYSLKVRQLERLQNRAALVVNALTAFYSAIGGFAASTLITLIGATLASSARQMEFRLAAGIALVVGGLAVGGLAIGCIILVRETRLAVLHLAEERELVRARFESLSRGA